MIQKRGHAEEDENDRVSSSKRSRASISPPLESLGVVERQSALRSTSEGGNHDIGHDNDDDEEEEDDDYTSSSGSSEDEDDGNNEQEADSDKKSETIPYIPGRPKPQISRPANSDLLSRISSFLPQLQAANADIEQRLAKGESLEDMILDDVKDDEVEGGEGGAEGRRYIEMVSRNPFCEINGLVC